MSESSVTIIPYIERYSNETKNLVCKVFQIPEEDYSRQHANLPFYGFLVKKRCKIIGAILAYRMKYMENYVHYVWALVIDEKYQSKGYGSKLLQTFIRTQAPDKVCLRIESNNERAKKFYEQHSFRRSEHVEDINYLGNWLYFYHGQL